MSLIDSIRRTFEDAARPTRGAAAPTRELERGVRAAGRPCTRDILIREIDHPDSPLRCLPRSRGTLAEVADACPPDARPLGTGDTVIARGRRGIRPTPEDAVRILGRELAGHSGAARARWSRLLAETR